MEIRTYQIPQVSVKYFSFMFNLNYGYVEIKSLMFNHVVDQELMLDTRKTINTKCQDSQFTPDCWTFNPHDYISINKEHKKVTLQLKYSYYK